MEKLSEKAVSVKYVRITSLSKYISDSGKQLAAVNIIFLLREQCRAESSRPTDDIKLLDEISFPTLNQRLTSLKLFIFRDD